MGYFEVPKLGRGPSVFAKRSVDLSSRDDPKKVPLEMEIVDHVAIALHTKYRGHFWGVQVQGGVLRIGIPLLLGNWTWNIPVSCVSTGPELRAVAIRAGGEILERFNIPRSDIETGLAQFLEARDNRVIRGNQQPPA